MHFFDEIATFFTGHIVPFLKNLGRAIVKAEIDSLKPIAEKVVADAASAVVSAAASGSTKQLGAVLAGIVTQAAADAESASISAGASAILASVGTALATNPATATNLAPVAPTV